MHDFIDLVELLNEEKAIYLVVGSFAMAHHGYVRATGDIDLFVEPHFANSEKVYRALKRFGAPCEAHGISESYFATAGNFYQLGLPPNRIDILTQISGLSFQEAAQSGVHGLLGKVPLHYLGLAELVKNKLAAGREKDLLDAAELKKRMAGA